MHPQHPGGCFATRVGAPTGSGSLFGGTELWSRGRRRKESRQDGKMEREGWREEEKAGREGYL